MAESTYSVTLNDSNSWLLGSPGLVRPLLVGSQRWPAGGTWCWLAAVVVVLLILSVLLCVWMSGCGLAHSITQPDQTTAERRRLDKERIIMIGVHRHRVGESGFKERKDVRTGKEKKKRRGLNPDIDP
ncbi:hypothetical protein P167DRAFT_190920 [Morchella conica CCBAS932]|uniref:Uncharacterized protein n=1 Tax=Morchella conica CCBAS932 TaxID=1392247 RepID=A0A3N4L1Q1_9PEZI|nr:hypothetical protein P167DRAFT_190920 [Morchella conica CCBAS932]